MINILIDDELLEIFDLCRMDEVATSSHLPWKWHRLAHVCRTWRNIIFGSSLRLNLELLCTHGTPVRKNLRYLPALPIVIDFPGYIKDCDEDNILAALEHPDRVHVLRLNVSYSLLKKMATVTQKPFPALTLLWLESKQDRPMPVLPDAFLGGCAPRLQRICLDGIPFPAIPTLLSSARDLIQVDLRMIPNAGYFSPGAMVASVAVLPRLISLSFGFGRDNAYPNRIRLPPITRRAVLPALIHLNFDGLFEYFEDFVAQIDTPQVDLFGIGISDDDEDVDFQIPQFCKFIDRSEKLQQSRFRRAILRITPLNAVIELSGQSSFTLSVQDEGISQVLNQIRGTLSSVDRLFISQQYTEYEELGDRIEWLGLLRPFTAVKALSVREEISYHVAPALNNVAGARAAEVLPALELLFLENRQVTSVKKFIAARRNVGRPVTFINNGREFRERLEPSVTE